MVGTWDGEAGEAGEHDAGEGGEVESGGRRAERLVVAGEAAEARQPAERALDHPAPGQEDEAAFRVVRLAHLQRDAARRRRALGRVAGVTRVDVGQLAVRAGRRLHRLGQRGDPGGAPAAVVG